MEKQYPHLQPFDKGNAVAAMNERMATNKIAHKNLARRRKDFASVSAKTGFNMPGSNKK